MVAGHRCARSPPHTIPVGNSIYIYWPTIDDDNKYLLFLHNNKRGIRIFHSASRTFSHLLIDKCTKSVHLA